MTRVDWQAADAGWRLEDLALTFGGGEDARCVGVSIKNHKHVTESGFDETFTQACWEQWLGGGRIHLLRPDRDQLVLVTGVLAGGVKVAWDALLGAALELAAAPERLVARLQPPAPGTPGSQSSEKQRALFQSLQCPPALRADSGTDDIATANLLRHIRLLHLDFESTPSAALSDALSACRVVLGADAADQADALWESLLRTAARKRGRGGSIELTELLAILRRRFALKDHPDYAGEWEHLARCSRERLAPVGLTVGSARLARRGPSRALSRQLRAGQTCVVVGSSGVGKSALVRRLGERRYRLVWLTGDLFHSGRESVFETQLGLRRPLAEVVAASPQRCLVVFDGVEGFNDSGLQLAARLVASLHGVAKRSARIALTVQPEGLSRLRAEFAGAGVHADSWEPLLLSPPGATAVEWLLARCPGLAAAALRPEFRALLRNLKVFDWVVRLQAGGGLADIGDIGTLTALIDRIWVHFVERGPAGLARAALLKRIAGVEADRLLPGLPVSELGAAEAELLSSLEATDLVLCQDERVRFTHDMFADWARLKILVERQLPESEEVVRRAAAPGWFRAVRLYAQRLLELPGAGVERWQRSLRGLGEGAPERLIIRDLFLEALIVANDSARLLRAAWPVLTAADGALLDLLLKRFVYVASLPDTRALSAIPDPVKAAELEHLIRVPFEPYWAGVLPVLADQPTDVMRCALAPTAKLLHFWLSKTRPANRSAAPLRDLAAGLILLIAREVQAREAEERGSVEEEERSEIYRALLCGAPERQAEVAQLCLELANRRSEAEPVRLRREAAREETRLAMERLPETNPKAAAFLREQRPFAEDRGPRLAPWPDGPRYRVDETFRGACLDWQAALFFAANCPAEALEVLLAVLIQSPTYQNLARNQFHRDQLEIADDPSHRPPFYDQGPFLVLLRCDPDVALALIIRLVNFATERWGTHQQALDERYGRDPARGPSAVRLLGTDGWVDHAGDKDVLLWLGGLRSHPTLVSSMLMALERWLYDETGAGRSVDAWVARILAVGRSAALLGVLVQLGKFRPALLAGPLRPLLSGGELYGMDHILSIERARVAFWNTDWLRHGETSWQRARDWYAMPHRKSLLLNLVLPLVLENEVVRADVLGFYPRWEERLGVAPDDPWLRGAVEQFAVAVEYSRAAADGGEGLTAFHERLESRRQQAVAAERQITEDMLPLTLAPQCRKRIDEGTPLPADHLVPFWDSLQRLLARVDEPDEGGTRAIDALLGGVAVLLVLHRDWVRADPAREEWCRALLLRCAGEHPGRRRFIDIDSFIDWGGDVFAAECGVVFLADNPSDALARQLVVNGLTCPRYGVVSATMARAYRLRTRLGGEFERMTAFVTEWSARVWALRWSAEWRLDSDRFWQSECFPTLEAFVASASVARRPLAVIDAEGRVRTATLFADYVIRVERRSEGRWQRVLRISGLLSLARWCRSLAQRKPTPPPSEADEDDTDELEEDRDYPSPARGVPPTWPGVEPHYLKAGFAWLEAAVAEEHVTGGTIDTLHDLLALTLRTVPASVPTRHSSRTRFPSKFDQWLLERIAAALLRMPGVRSADELWRPIVALGLRGEFWVKYFLSDCFQLITRQSPEPEVFVAVWGQMIRCALDESNWDTQGRRWNQGEEMVKDLLGFDLGKVVFGADERYARPVGRLLPEFERAAERWFHSAKVATGFCYFAIKPAGIELLLPGVRWLATAEPSWSAWEWENTGLADALVDLLRAVLTRDRTRVATDDGLRTGYISLCNKLVARGHHAALALRERVATP